MRKAMPETRTQEAGFTLVEALMAIVILVFGLMAIANLFVIAMSSNTAANQSTAAVNLAAQYVEQLKATGFENIHAGGYTHDDAVNGVGNFHTVVSITEPDAQTRFIRVQTQAKGLLAERTRAEFTTFRVCTSVANGCPVLAP